ncbi:S-adenosyl-L-methionine-dependent methyltransferase [Mycena olivaceomarginata]|nr:S-adenosyl-L-methionine-dependent methyltransferase [Mycena olivaceomarginata]
MEDECCHMMSPPSAYAALTPPSFIFLRAYLFAVLWKWLVNFARSSIIASLERGIVTGRLEIFDPEIGFRSFGVSQEGENDPHTAVLVVKDTDFWIRILFSYDIGFAEAYMAGDFHTPDLRAVLNLYVDNLEHLSRLASPFYRLLRTRDVCFMFFLRHGVSQSVRNAAGYNASNDMYRAFLSKEMMYSCPLWGEEEGGVRGDLDGHRRARDLEAAQARKVAHILRKAGLRPGDRLLEIGSGWGGLAIAAAKLGCTVDTITISIEQQTGARENVRNAGVEDRVQVHLMDYRNMPPSFEKAFDACISIEMLEAVGVKYMKSYLSRIDWALKDSRAAVVLTSTTYPESSYTPYQGNDFTRKYHWPNGVSPSPTSILADFDKYIPGRFCVESVEDMGTHYPRCLREWGRRFEANWTEELGATMMARYPELKDPESMEMFRRKWAYMFSYMEVAYSRWWLGLTCWSVKRPGRDGTICS